MKSHSRTLLVITLALGFGACQHQGNRNSPMAPRFNNGPVVAPGMAPNTFAAAPVFPNAPFIRQGIQCDPANTNPNDQRSPYNYQSPCYNPAMVQAAQAQSQGVNSPNGVTTTNVGNSNTSTGPFPNIANTLSIDIPQDNSGRIVNLHLRITHGAGVEEVKDPCNYFNRRDSHALETAHSDDNPTQHVGRFLTPRTDRFDMNFDAQGNLTVWAQTIDGEVWTTSPILPGQYTLDPTTQTLHVNSFDMSGPARPQFVEYERALEKRLAALDNKNIADEENIRGSIPSSLNVAGMGGGGQGRQGFSLGTSDNSFSPTVDFRNLPLSPLNLGPSTIKVTVDDLTAYVGTHTLQPQHVVGFYIENLPYHSWTDVSAKPQHCQADGVGRLIHLMLERAQ